MKRPLIFVIFCLLVPSWAHADDGWWDFLWRMDPKFSGPNGELQLCFDKQGQFQQCEGLFGLVGLVAKARGGRFIRKDPGEIKHEFALRLGYYYTYGETYPNSPPSAPSLKGARVQVMYYYHPDTHIRVGLGIGVLPLWGDAVPDDRSNLILTPMAIVYSPYKASSRSRLKSFFVRGETTRIIGGLNQPGPTPTTFSAAPEWNFAFGAGFDLRRW